MESLHRQLFENSFQDTIKGMNAEQLEALAADLDEAACEQYAEQFGYHILQTMRSMFTMRREELLVEEFAKDIQGLPMNTLMDMCNSSSTIMSISFENAVMNEIEKRQLEDRVRSWFRIAHTISPATIPLEVSSHPLWGLYQRVLCEKRPVQNHLLTTMQSAEQLEVHTAFMHEILQRQMQQVAHKLDAVSLSSASSTSPFDIVYDLVHFIAPCHAGYVRDEATAVLLRRLSEYRVPEKVRNQRTYLAIARSILHVLSLFDRLEGLMRPHPVFTSVLAKLQECILCEDMRDLPINQVDHFVQEHVYILQMVHKLRTTATRDLIDYIELKIHTLLLNMVHPRPIATISVTSWLLLKAVAKWSSIQMRTLMSDLVSNEVRIPLLHNAPNNMFIFPATLTT